MSILVKRLYKNILALTVLQGANYILPLITIPYLVRVLGPEKFGLIAFSQAFIGYFIILTNYGFDLSATRKIAMVKDNPRKVAEIFSTVMVIKLGLFIVGFIIMAGIIFVTPYFYSDWLLYVVCYLAVAGSVLFPVWLFQGMENMRAITIYSILARAIIVCGIFLWVNSEGDYIIAAALQSIAFLVAGILSLAEVNRLIANRLIFPSRAQIIEELKDGWHVFISTASVSFYSISNVFILGLIAGNTMVGYFSAAEKLIKAVQGLFRPVTQSIYPYLGSMVKKSKKQALVFIHKSLLWLGTLAILSSLTLLVFVEPIVKLVFGQEFVNETVPIVSIMSFLPFVIVLSNVFGIQTMLTFGFEKEFSKILVGAGLINLVIIAPLIILFEASGAAISVLVTEVLVTSMMGVFLNRKGIKPWFNTESLK